MRSSHSVLGERLRGLREKRGLSQVDFGERTGLPNSYISRIENGQIVPDLDTLERMTTALGVPLYTPFLANQDFCCTWPRKGPREGQSNRSKQIDK
jgi:transcriptional regulator with XRE-family HTH domain